jgi:anhydro-N-acetylmuramic acid kinase
VAHAWLFRDPRRGRAVQNLGGIGNVTYLPPGRGTAGVIAFDTGPANMVIDALVRRVSKGTRWFDRDGRAAARGRVDWSIVRAMLRHPYFRQRPPKSSGRELFGAAYVDDLVARGRRRRLASDDLIATATALTAASCADACRRFVRRRGPLDELILSGGGAANPTLVGFLRDLFPDVRIRTTGELGLPAQAVEPVAFAGLAAAALFGLPGNLPAVTGAARPLVLGKITPGASYRRVALGASRRVAPPRARR